MSKVEHDFSKRRTLFSVSTKNATSKSSSLIEVSKVKSKHVESSYGLLRELGGSDDKDRIYVVKNGHNSIKVRLNLSKPKPAQASSSQEGSDSQLSSPPSTNPSPCPMRPSETVLLLTVATPASRGSPQPGPNNNHAGGSGMEGIWSLIVKATKATIHTSDLNNGEAFMMFVNYSKLVDATPMRIAPFDMLTILALRPAGQSLSQSVILSELAMCEKDPSLLVGSPTSPSDHTFTGLYSFTPALEENYFIMNLQLTAHGSKTRSGSIQVREVDFAVSDDGKGKEKKRQKPEKEKEKEKERERGKLEEEREKVPEKFQEKDKERDKERDKDGKEKEKDWDKEDKDREAKRETTEKFWSKKNAKSHSRSIKNLRAEMDASNIAHKAALREKEVEQAGAEEYLKEIMDVQINYLISEQEEFQLRRRIERVNNMITLVCDGVSPQCEDMQYSGITNTIAIAKYNNRVRRMYRGFATPESQSGRTNYSRMDPLSAISPRVTKHQAVQPKSITVRANSEDAAPSPFGGRRKESEGTPKLLKKRKSGRVSMKKFGEMSSDNLPVGGVATLPAGDLAQVAACMITDLPAVERKVGGKAVPCVLGSDAVTYFSNLVVTQPDLLQFCPTSEKSKERNEGSSAYMKAGHAICNQMVAHGFLEHVGAGVDEGVESRFYTYTNAARAALSAYRNSTPRDLQNPGVVVSDVILKVLVNVERVRCMLHVKVRQMIVRRFKRFQLEDIQPTLASLDAVNVARTKRDEVLMKMKKEKDPVKQEMMKSTVMDASAKYSNLRQEYLLKLIVLDEKGLYLMTQCLIETAYMHLTYMRLGSTFVDSFGDLLGTCISGARLHHRARASNADDVNTTVGAATTSTPQPLEQYEGILLWNKKPRWVVCAEGYLCVYKSWQETCLLVCVDLTECDVRPKSNETEYCVEVYNNKTDLRLVLQTRSEKELNRWLGILKRASTHQLFGK
mmetsp:Transcript_10710/g.27073  ORF Transcript_10710/g.27073 Transcript_10710/m.27073 type:complete len:961 (-) Transcript_10710:185-3067(-)|eukprot:CAMPEP_0177642286 /NCGR_PEP_ID=MMETSP0447-20121125/7504_1 /TAXON_ID=0 /ORGANISM="Stygamoeba regulata, Strain BSH-02190019" /LENGTH=960 /DNA_ID=CAMNT_0019144431 /DNA_START=542 /DNA_END=3424 /DNA_ORIENTATION=-